MFPFAAFVEGQQASVVYQPSNPQSLDEVAHQLALAFELLGDQGKQLFCLFQVYLIQVSYAGQERKVSLVTRAQLTIEVAETCPLGYGTCSEVCMMPQSECFL
jgi:peroxiredoxin